MYQKYISCLIPKFWNITFDYFPRANNQSAEALATLASMVKLVEGDEMRQLRIEVCGLPAYYMNIKECMNVKAEINEKPWYRDMKAYIKNGEYLSGAKDSERKFIRHMACQFILSGEVLYKRNHDTTLL